VKISSQNIRLFIPVAAGFILTCVLLLSSCAGVPTGAPISLPTDKGPYLVFTGTFDSMTVMWQTRKTPSFSEISWGPTTSYGNSAVTTENSSSPAYHQFSYTLTGLSPNTRTYYRVSTNFGTYESYFWSAPDPSATSLIFYAYGDTRSNPAEHNVIMTRMQEDMAAHDVQGTFLLHSGDFGHRGLDESILQSQFFYQAPPETRTMESRVPIMYAIGNHDCYTTSQDYSYTSSAGSLLRKYWPYKFLPHPGRSYYSFEFGPVFVLVLDEYTRPGYCTPPDDTEQYNWATSEISATTKPWKIVMFHEPAWGPKKEPFPTDDHGDHLNMQHYYQPVFVNSSVEVVLEGHNHMYARCVTEEVNYVTSAGGGSPLYVPQLDSPCLVTAEAVYNFMRFTITGNIMTAEAMDDQGTVIDTFSVVH
jgi:Calcineurin-like phosphoesterase/Purple acid Phosphatase, N-terminal domain